MGHDSQETERLVGEFEEYLRTQGLKLTRQRRIISTVFLGQIDGHRTLSQLLEACQGEMSSIGYATVYRTMKLMTESGVAVEHKFVDGGEALFEPNVEGDHHDHIICLTCGKIFEFEDEAIEQRQDRIAAEHGFAVRRHRHEIYGDCLKDPCVHRGTASA